MTDILLNDIDWQSEISAPPPTAGDIKSPEDYADSAYDWLTGAEQGRGGRMPWEDIDWRFQPGDFNIWLGQSGSGKSMITTQMMIWLCRDGGSDRDEKAIFFSPEMPAKVQIARMAAMIAGVSNPTREYFQHIVEWLGGRVYIYDRSHKVTVDELRGIALFGMRHLGVTNLVVDSLVKVWHPKMNAQNQNLVQTEVADDLAVLARDTGLIVNLVCHARKSERETDRIDKFSLKGSGAIADLCSNLWAVTRNIKKAEVQKGLRGNLSDEEVERVLGSADASIECLKNRNGGTMERIGLYYQECGQFTKAPGRVLRIPEVEESFNAE